MTRRETYDDLWRGTVWTVPKRGAIGLLGCGTVGRRLRRAGRPERAGRGRGRRRDAPRSPACSALTSGDPEEILAELRRGVEVMGGLDPALDHSWRACARQAGGDGQQAALARHGPELFAAAREAGVELRFEAAVAGVIPVIRVIQESLGVAEIIEVFGIVNGTTNFILSEMASTGAAYAEVLARAQELGYAEADPTEDVNGADAAAKMAILARLAFHTPVALERSRSRGSRASRPRTSPTPRSSASR